MRWLAAVCPVATGFNRGVCGGVWWGGWVQGSGPGAPFLPGGSHRGPVSTQASGGGGGARPRRWGRGGRRRRGSGGLGGGGKRAVWGSPARFLLTLSPPYAGSARQHGGRSLPGAVAGGRPPTGPGRRGGRARGRGRRGQLGDRHRRGRGCVWGGVCGSRGGWSISVAPGGGGREREAATAPWEELKNKIWRKVENAAGAEASARFPLAQGRAWELSVGWETNGKCLGCRAAATGGRWGRIWPNTNSAPGLWSTHFCMWEVRILNWTRWILLWVAFSHLCKALSVLAPQRERFLRNSRLCLNSVHKIKFASLSHN